MPTLFIIAGCNGAGKTTAAFTLLPELLDCREFVNADEIARGISPFQPERVAVEAGRIMLSRIKRLVQMGETFGFETTLATKTYTSLLEEARSAGYEIVLIFFWLNSSELAVERVKSRVASGGHHIERDVIERRYSRGLTNLRTIYIHKVDQLIIFDNSAAQPELVAAKGSDTSIYREDIYHKILDL